VSADRPDLWHHVARNWSVRIGGTVLAIIVTMSLLAPWLVDMEPEWLSPGNGYLRPGHAATVTQADGSKVPHTFWMGSDEHGRDIYSRLLHGGRVSLGVGGAVAFLSLLIGGAIGLAIASSRWLDAVAMRLMDGLMAIPGILVALALVAIWGAHVGTVIAAITLTEIPRVARLMRSVVLSVREEPYVEAARAAGTSTVKILYRHILPNTVTPLVVQGTYICGLAILIEASLGFLGVGLPDGTPTWGNIMADGRQTFLLHPHIVLLPGLFLSLAILALNMLGDGLRDTLDPRFSLRGDRS
jgi:peptide/nickel transport system permease protein